MLTHFNLRPYASVTGVMQPITVRSIAWFVWALVWAALLLISFTGWGRLTGKLFRMRRLPASVACSLGIATIVFLGGWLNLVHAIYPVVLFTLTAIGFLLYFALRRERPEEYKWLQLWKNAPRWSQILLILTLLILILRVAATVRLGEFYVTDDGSGYLVFAQKMLAAHHFAVDPFSDRRVISSLGGSYILQAFVIATTSLSNVGMADRTFGLILIFFVLVDLGIAFGLSPQKIAVMELIVYIIPQETFNLTFTILPIALFLAMIWIIYLTPEQEEHQRWRSALLMGAIGGGILSLKSTFLPCVGTIALIPYVLLFWRKKRSQAWMLPILAGIGSIVTVLAWMIAMKHASGTFLFPILGHGVDFSSYGLFSSMPRFSSSRAAFKIFIQGAALLLLAGFQYYVGIHDRKARISFSILIASALAITAFNYESGGDFIWRYNFPQFFTAIAVFYVAQAAIYPGRASFRKTKAAYGLAVLCLVSCIFYYDLEGGAFKPFRQMRMEMQQYPHNLRASLSGRHLVSRGIAAEYGAAEAVLPAGATALDISIDSFLFTNKDNKRIFLDDWPGAAGPAPGWPLTQGPEAVAKYLLRNSVRYVIYDYQYADWSNMNSCQFFPSVAHLSVADEKLEILNLVTLHQFNQLRALHKSIYDDGKFAIIDLESPASTNPTVEPNWTIHTSVTQMCGVIAPKYIAAHPSGVLPNGAPVSH
jgi:hypothetical protein